MSIPPSDDEHPRVPCFSEFAKLVDYSFMENLNRDPHAAISGEDYAPRQVFSGHYVPVKPTPLPNPIYIAHSSALFTELGLDESLAKDEGFVRLFSGDMTHVPESMRKFGWATGYALSIYGTEYKQQCPFQTGNGYGDGRAISVFEGVLNQQRWEMQLKGAGRTPYCRGADGRAVLRSSVREFLAQEHMHALGVPTSRSLSLFVSETERTQRPWYSEGSEYDEPDVMMADPVAISTRVAPSFLRVGQLELFGRRARSNEHSEALQELEMIVVHLIEREYQDSIDSELPLSEKILALALAFRDRLTTLITHWLRVGYCQGNFNSDNCACGGFTLDYGPFGFCEKFEPFFQPWTGGGRHFSFLNQPAAARENFNMFCIALQPLLADDKDALTKLEGIGNGFSEQMQNKMDQMWASKLGLSTFDEALFGRLFRLMVDTSVDYTLFFRELSAIPEELRALSKSFYQQPTDDLRQQWQQWLQDWRAIVTESGDVQEISRQMQQVNPKYTWREWKVVPAYQQAAFGNFALVHELQDVLTKPYEEQSQEVEAQFYHLKPQEFFGAGGVSHYTCSS